MNFSSLALFELHDVLELFRQIQLFLKGSC